MLEFLSFIIIKIKYHFRMNRENCNMIAHLQYNPLYGLFLCRLESSLGSREMRYSTFFFF